MQRWNIKYMYYDLVQLGYAGSYGRVVAFARHWYEQCQEAERSASKYTFVPLSYMVNFAFGCKFN